MFFPDGRVRQDQPRLWSRGGLLCVLVVAACLLLTWPLVEMGINDDWCYTLIAWGFGHTGHLTFHGWASPILGWQAVWGGWAARLWGYSFNVVRLSMVPITLMTVLLFHAVLRGFHLNRAHALLGTLTFALSPVLLPNADTFMTDIPCLFALFVCLFLCQHALAARSTGQALAYLAAAALSNVLLGTVRQIAWLGVLVIVPCCGFLLRKQRRAKEATILLWLGGSACIGVIMHWFKYQPYTAPEAILPRDLGAGALGKVVKLTWRSAVTITYLCLPVLASGLAVLKKVPRRFRPWLAGFAVAVLLGCLWTPSRHALLITFSPWLGNTMNRTGILQGGLLFGAARGISEGWLVVMLLALVFSVVAFAASGSHAGTHDPVQPQFIDREQRRVLLLPFALAYSVLLIPRAAQFTLFDRYLLELVAVALVFLLWFHQERVSAKVPFASYAFLVLFGALATAGTHDLFALERARVRLFAQMQRSGIPATAIRAGFELDSMTQVASWGYLNDPRILVPRNAFHPQPPQVAATVHPECVYRLQQFVPAVQPRYALATDDSACIVGRVIGAATYRTWLPFGVHSVVAGTPRYP